MISPTRLAIWATAAGAPAALLIGLLLPRLWVAGLAWPAAVILLTLVDVVLVGRGRQAGLTLAMPRTMPVGGDGEARLAIVAPAAAKACEVAIAGDPLLLMEEEGRGWASLDDDGRGEAVIALHAVRRGTARIGQSWLRWKGPLGLVWKQVRQAESAETIILPDVRPVHERGARLFERTALQGLLAQSDRGEGLDFDALVEYRSGMDRRAIDWKQSARHRKLHAKEYRTERNDQVVFAVDCGRQMSEPLGGLPRMDHAVSAMLLTAWIVLKLGDRVALHAFDSRPRIASGLVTGTAGFGELQKLAAQIDYGADETNYTYALTTLGARLKRRSMIVLFTEFTDMTSAEFMVRAAARLAETHLLLVVVFRDDELQAFVDHVPQGAEDVTRAVTAATLQRDRNVVLLRLRHLGIHVIECGFAQVADQLAEAYVDLKRRGLL